MVYIGNLGRELSSPAASLTLVDKLAMMEQIYWQKVIDAVVVGPRVYRRAERSAGDSEVPEASDIPYATIVKLLHNALEKRYRRWVASGIDDAVLIRACLHRRVNRLFPLLINCVQLPPVGRSCERAHPFFSNISPASSVQMTDTSSIIFSQ